MEDMEIEYWAHGNLALVFGVGVSHGCVSKHSPYNPFLKSAVLGCQQQVDFICELRCVVVLTFPLRLIGDRNTVTTISCG